MFVIWSNHKCVATYLLSVCLLYFLVLRFPRVSPSHPMVYLKYLKILWLQYVGGIFVSFIPFNIINLLVPLYTQDPRSKRSASRFKRVYSSELGVFDCPWFHCIGNIRILKICHFTGSFWRSWWFDNHIPPYRLLIISLLHPLWLFINDSSSYLFKGVL